MSSTLPLRRPTRGRPPKKTATSKKAATPKENSRIPAMAMAMPVIDQETSSGDRSRSTWMWRMYKGASEFSVVGLAIRALIGVSFAMLVVSGYNALFGGGPSSPPAKPEWAEHWTQGHTEALVSSAYDPFREFSFAVRLFAPKTIDGMFSTGIANASLAKHSPGSSSESFLRDAMGFFVDVENTVRDVCVAAQWGYLVDGKVVRKRDEVMLGEICTEALDNLASVQALFLDLHSEVGNWWIRNIQIHVGLMREKLDLWLKHAAHKDVFGQAGGAEGASRDPAWRNLNKTGVGFSLPSGISRSQFSPRSMAHATGFLDILAHGANCLPAYGDDGTGHGCSQLRELFDAKEKAGSLSDLLFAAKKQTITPLPAEDLVYRLSSLRNHTLLTVQTLAGQAINTNFKKASIQPKAVIHGLEIINSNILLQMVQQLQWYESYVHGLLATAASSCVSIHEIVSRVNSLLSRDPWAWITNGGFFTLLEHPRDSLSVLEALEASLAVDVGVGGRKHALARRGVDELVAEKRTDGEKRRKLEGKMIKHEEVWAKLG